MTNTQLAISIIMPLIVIANAWIVAGVSSRWKKQPPKPKAVIKVLSMILDTIILLIFPAFCFLSWDSGPVAIVHFVILMSVMSAFFTLHALFYFYKWIRPHLAV